MNIVIVGMGIIGGSYAKAIKKYTEHTVIGINRSPEPVRQALECGAIDEIGTPQSLSTADLILLCVYPQAAIDYIKENGAYIKKGAVVSDTSGIKAMICPELTALSKQLGFTFVGCHPMAGKEKNGFAVSDPDLFQKASCIIVPCESDEPAVKTLTDLAKAIGFGTIKYTTPEEHDRMIAFTSQVPHVLACAYVMSPNCMNHKGFSAGSYRDVSRVANINADLWSELFLENKMPLLEELDVLLQNIEQIKAAVAAGDRQRLRDLLHKGRQVKEALGE